MYSFINEQDKYRLNLFARAASTTMKAWFWFDLNGWHDEFLANPPAFIDGKVTDPDGTTFVVQDKVTRLAAKQPGFGGDYQTFTIVRNPFGRMVSAYFAVFERPKALKSYIGRNGAERIPGSFEEFVTLLDEGRLPRDAHWRPQLDLPGPSGHLLRFESLQKGFDEMCSLLGKRTGKLPHYHKPQTGPREAHPAELYTRRMADVVRHLYAGDFERFGYSTQLPGSA